MSVGRGHEDVIAGKGCDSLDQTQCSEGFQGARESRNTSNDQQLRRYVDEQSDQHEEVKCVPDTEHVSIRCKDEAIRDGLNGELSQKERRETDLED